MVEGLVRSHLFQKFFLALVHVGLSLADFLLVCFDRPLLGEDGVRQKELDVFLVVVDVSAILALGTLFGVLGFSRLDALEDAESAEVLGVELQHVHGF